MGAPILTPEKRAELVHRYASAGGSAALGDEYGISPSAVRQAGRRAGATSPLQRPVTDRERERAAALAAQGVQRQETARLLGRHRWTVWHMLNRGAVED